jgi:hypothetical protein|nr:MAG TPA: hypothetical protein [Caudoviricetes sp.]
MALTINDVITLGKMGFTKTDIAALMGAQPGTPVQTTPAPVAPQSAPAAVPATQTNVPAAPDYGALVAGLADLSEKVSALSVPSAGIVGNPAPVTSVEDIILGAYQPKQTSTDVPDFSKGVIK